MNKCFITKFPSSISNEELPVLGYVSFHVSPTKIISTGIVGMSVDDTYILSKQEFVNANGAKLGNKVASITNVYFPIGDSIFRVKQDNLVGVYEHSSDYNVSCNLGIFKYCSNLGTLQLRDKQIVGNISDISSLSELTAIILTNTNIEGDISVLSNLPKVSSVILYDSKKITGDISKLASKTSLTSLKISNTSVYGDIATLSTLSNLKELWVGNTGVTGDMTSIVNSLTKLTSVNIPESVTITEEQKTALTNRGCTISVF